MRPKRRLKLAQRRPKKWPSPERLPSSNAVRAQMLTATPSVHWRRSCRPQKQSFACRGGRMRSGASLQASGPSVDSDSLWQAELQALSKDQPEISLSLLAPAVSKQISTVPFTAFCNGDDAAGGHAEPPAPAPVRLALTFARTRTPCVINRTTWRRLSISRSAASWRDTKSGEAVWCLLMICCTGNLAHLRKRQEGGRRLRCG